MKKKFIVLLLLTASLIFIVSCEKDLINNADTGEIVLSEPKYTYADGTYFCGYDYFGQDGYAAAMKMVVDKGVIKSIRFDYFDKNGKAMSETDDDTMQASVSELRSVRKSLYNHTLAKQNISGLQHSSADRFTRDYCTLASEILYSASSDGENIITAKSINTYSSTVNLTQNVLATLTVTCLSDEISELDFDITDPNGSSLSLDGATCMEVFGLSADDTSKAISALEDRHSLKKENTEEALKAISDVYDSLCENILLMRIQTGFNYNKLF